MANSRSIKSNQDSRFIQTSTPFLPWAKTPNQKYCIVWGLTCNLKLYQSSCLLEALIDRIEQIIL